MGSTSNKRRMGPIEKQGVVQAYVMLVPTVAIVMAIVLFPLIANFWISFKDVTVSDLRTAEIKVNEKFKNKPIKEGDISETEYRFNNFSKSSQITEVTFEDIIPYGLKVLEIPNNCKILDRKLVCDLGTFKPKEKKKLRFTKHLPQSFMERFKKYLKMKKHLFIQEVLMVSLNFMHIG